MPGWFSARWACFKWFDSLATIGSLEKREDRKAFVLNLMCFAACIEELFFFPAFATCTFVVGKDFSMDWQQERIERTGFSGTSVPNPFGFLELQDVQEQANFFERTVSAYLTGVEGTVSFDEDL